MTPYDGHAVDMRSCMYVVGRKWLYDSIIYCRYYIIWSHCTLLEEFGRHACVFAQEAVQVILTAQATGSGKTDH